MRIWVGLAALLVSGGTASAMVVQPRYGVTATEAVGALRNLHVVSGTGTPGTNLPNYNPAGYFDTTNAAVSAYSTGISNNGTNLTYATGSASVDLASEQMHLVANSKRRGSGANDTSIAHTSVAGVMSDTIHNVGAITGQVTIRVSMTVDGSFLGSAQSALHNSKQIFHFTPAKGVPPHHFL